MGGQSPQNSTVTNTTQVDPVTQAWRSNIMNAGATLYNQGTPSYYPGQTVTPFSNQTQSGLDYLQGQAQQGAPNLGAANDAGARALSGYNPAMPYAQNAAAGGLQNTAAQGVLGASQTQVAPHLNPMIQGASQQNPWAQASAQAGQQQTTMGVDALNGFASAQNPHLQSMFNQGAEQIGNAVNSNFAQAGRFGSNAAHSGAMTRELGNLWSNINMPAYENAQNRALSAAQMLPGIQQQDRNAQMQGYGQAGSLYEAGAGRGLQGAGLYGSALTGDAGRAYQGAADYASFGENGLDRQFQGAGLYGNMYSQGNQDAARTTALLPGLYGYGQQPGQALLDVGNIYEQQAQNYLNDDRARYEYAGNAPWDYLSQYANMMSGLPDFSGSTQTTTQPGPNRLMTGLGTAASAASIFAAFSDRRLKEEIVPIGFDAKGNKWYKYRYKWDDAGTVRTGVMADEAPAHAVSIHPSGFAIVDYSAL